ncbi:hypothetical protein A9K55_003669 [Cordyceps militaris]|uniref:Uncharacterized protein n=1 Tax=Cordyceps militaris TaxID=73501 RepID=A0A2H4S8A8_CORMI|nr:hypothetical protein A9K55_003669 [Cordyceps militaris]
MGCGGSKLDLSRVDSHELLVIACPKWHQRHVLKPEKEINPEDPEEMLAPEEKNKILIRLLKDCVEKFVPKHCVNEMKLHGSCKYEHGSGDYDEVLCVAWDAGSRQLSSELEDHFTKPTGTINGVGALSGVKFVKEPIIGGGFFIVLDSFRKGADQK